jgi:hypothetical protein
MPSPFPGMDPYLESAEHFPDLHDALVYCIRSLLQPVLPEPYFAKMRQHVWVSVSERFVEPDVDVMIAAGARAGNQHVAQAATAEEPVVVTVQRTSGDEHTESSVEIYRWEGSDKRLVTAVEVLSVSNKTRGNLGRELYLKKQAEMLASRANLFELDLLHRGEHTVAVPLEMARRQCGDFDYLVCCHRFDRPSDYLLNPIPLAEKLPPVSVPLLPADGSVTLDLQMAFDQAYDSGPYRREVHYLDEPPDAQLADEQLRWARSVVEQKFGQPPAWSAA